MAKLIQGWHLTTTVSAITALFLLGGCDLHEASLGKDDGSRAKLEEIDRKLTQLDELTQKVTKIQEDLQALKEKGTPAEVTAKAPDANAIAEALKAPLRTQIDEAVRAAMKDNGGAKMATAPAASSDDNRSSSSRSKAPAADSATGPIDVTIRQFENNKGAAPK